jgi:NAD(P)H-dependent FMN reductase
MAAPKILVIPGSLRTGSYNVMLAALAVKELALADVEVTRLSLEDYPLPIYDADVESRGGAPAAATKLKQMIAAHHGVLMVSPEYNASLAPLVKNSIDWVSRVREGNEGAYAAFRGRVFAIASASPNAFGGMRASSTRTEAERAAALNFVTSSTAPFPSAARTGRAAGWRCGSR